MVNPAIHQPPLVGQLRSNYPGIMGDFRLHFPVLFVEWRSRIDGVWCHPRLLWKQCGCDVPG